MWRFGTCVKTREKMRKSELETESVNTPNPVYSTPQNQNVPHTPTEHTTTWNARFKDDPGVLRWKGGENVRVRKVDFLV